MNSLSPLSPEFKAQISIEDRCGEALERAREAKELAGRPLRLAAEMLASAINDELGHLPNTQEVARLRLGPEYVHGLVAQLLEDLTYDAINALSREAGE